MVDEIESLFSKSIPYDVSGVLSTELTKIVRFDDHSDRLAAHDLVRFEPSSRDPVFDLLDIYVKSSCQGVLREAVLAHFGVSTKTVQHMED